MSAPYNPHIDLEVGRGHGLHVEINRQAVQDSYGAIGMAELARLCEFPAVRVDVSYRCSWRPEPAAMARMIADELARDEIWDWRPLIAPRGAAASARRPCLPVVQPAERNGNGAAAPRRCGCTTGAVRRQLSGRCRRDCCCRACYSGVRG